MKVLTKNIKLSFECENDCPEQNRRVIQTDPADLIESGHPVCPTCNEKMTLDNWCLVTN